MINAMRLMYAGAALAALGILAAAATVPALRAAVRQQYPDAGYGGCAPRRPALSRSRSSGA